MEYINKDIIRSYWFREGWPIRSDRDFDRDREKKIDLDFHAFYLKFRFFLIKLISSKSFHSF